MADSAVVVDTADAAVRVIQRRTAPARLTSAVAVDTSTVRVQFDKVLLRRDSERLVFKIDGLAIRSVKFPLGRTAWLKTDAQGVGALKLTVTTAGAAGSAPPVGTATFLSAATPRPTSAVAVDGSTVRVQFNKVVLRRDSERLVFNIDGLAIRSVKFPLGRTAWLKTDSQVAGPLTVTVSTGGTAGPTPIGTATFDAKPAPKVVSVIALDEDRIRVTYDRPMRESALVASNYSINDEATGGPLSVTSAAYASSASVIDLVTAPQAYSSYSFSVNNVTDTYGQQVFFEGRKILTGNPKGAVVSVGSTSSTTVVVAFNEAMADNALAPQHYVIKDPDGKVLPVTRARFDGPLGMVVHLTTAVQAHVRYQLTVSNVTDLQNDGMDVRTASFQGVAGPGLSQAVATDPTSVLLTFTAAVGDSALAPSAYKVDRLDAAGTVIGSLPVSSAAFVGGQRTVIKLTTATQDGGRYRITTTDALTDTAGSTLPAVQLEFQGISGMPRLESAAPSAPNTILLTFSKPMSDDALSPSSYVIKDSGGVALTVLSAQFVGTEHRVVRLNTGPQRGVAYSIQSISATDINGNPVTAPGTTGGFQGSPSPSLSGATPADPTHVTLTFAGPVGDTALAPSSYRIDKLDASGNVVGGLPVNAAAFVGGQRTVVSLTTATQEGARYRISTTGSLTDAAGLTLPVGQTDFQGISGQPVMVGVSSTGPSTLLLTFNVPMSDDALSPSAYVIRNSAGGTLPVLNVRFVGTERRIVELTTSPQANQTYTVVSISATGSGGGETTVPTSPTINSFPGLGTPGESTSVVGAPKVVGAASLSNTEVIVSFSEPMGAGATRPEYYFIVQQNVNPESGYLQVIAADWYDSTHSVVKLTTRSQNELTYAVTAVAVTDVAGNALASPILGAGGIVIDPRTAQFPGTPPRGLIPGGTIDSNNDGKIVSDPLDPEYDPPVEPTMLDTDGDGLPDNVEMRGWKVTVQLADKTKESRTVTSDPTVFDTDGDGLSDYQEANIRTDPRSKDTDDDQINDFAEFNELYSNALDQDSDDDGLDDFVEFAFFRTSPVFADTDGDQIADGAEIVGNRNPLVSDLPRPEIEVGDINLQLAVQFTESNAQERRDLETQTVSTTLSSSEQKSLTRQYTASVEAKIEGGYGGKETSWFLQGSVTAGFTYNQTEASATEATRSYERSLSTDREVTRGFTVERTVTGAVMQVAVDLRNVSNLAYRVRNLQITALIQDPLDHTRMTPVATLVPDREPPEGYTLGPLVTNRGPIVFSNDTIVPTLVESLMANSSGLIFRISNYDIVDEADRNFAFVSQDVVERTSLLVVDFGGARSLRAQVSGETIDENQPGDETEILRVATSYGQVIDTNFDGTIDENDRRATFDSAGKEVGITLRDALAAAGLTRYDEATTPAGSLTDDQILKSYSTFFDGTREKIFRIRGVANDPNIQKYWEILTPDGIDQVTDLNDLVLKTDSPASLNFVQDLDGDGLPADVEFLMRTSDQRTDTDGDTLDDRFEALIGWTVETPQRRYQVYSSPNRPDSNFDTPKPGVDGDGDGTEDRLEYDGSDTFAAPGGWTDTNGNGLRDPFEVTRAGTTDYVLDPVRRDTDGDGISDATELIGFVITPITGAPAYRVTTDPTTPFTDTDTFTDGFERLVNLNPTNGDDTDEDGDGLPDPVEKNQGWVVRTFEKSDSPFVQGTATSSTRFSRTDSVDSDGDGLTDYEEFFLATDPSAADSDRDGIDDRREYLGYALGHKVDGDDLGVIKTDPLDADTDNDKRSDGAEAELKDVELARWVVRPDDKTPYRVFSNPLVADADFDGLVDGDEIAFGTDPNNGNTDGDKRDDGKEFTAGTNPLVEDFQVTVFFSSLTITRDGDEGGAGAGDFGFDLGFRRPDVSQPAGLSTQFTSVLRANANLTGPFQYGLGGPGDPQVSPTEAALPALDAGQTQQSLRNNGPSIYGINMDDGATLNFGRLLPENLRSRSFGMTKNDFFSVEGIIVELDGFSDDGNPLNDSLTSVYLGGLEGLRAQEKAKDEAGNDVTNTIRPVFFGADLLADPKRFRDLTFTFKTADNDAVGANPGTIEGSLSMFFIVS